MPIDEKPFRAACAAYAAVVGNYGLNNGAMEKALEAYEAAKAEQPDKLSENLVTRVANALRKAASHEPENTYEFYESNGETCSPESLAKAAIACMPMRESVALEHIFETEKGQNPYRARVLDLCYTAFLSAKAPNNEDGGPSDWMNDTEPKIKMLIEQMKRNVIEG